MRKVKLSCLLLGIFLLSCGTEELSNPSQLDTDKVSKSEMNIASTQYYFRVVSSNKCIQVDGASPANGANITQWNCYNQNHFKITPSFKGNGYYQLASPIVESVSMSNRMETYHKWTCQSGDRFLWSLSTSSNGQTFVRNKSTGSCMHQKGAVFSNGGNIDVWPCINQDNVKFYLDRI